MEEKFHPFAYEISFKNNEALAKRLADILNNRPLLWFNSLSGRNLGHDDLMSLSNLDDGFGYMIKNYHANIIQTDIPFVLTKYYISKGMR